MRDTSYKKNYKMTNKGKLFEEKIIKLNEFMAKFINEQIMKAIKLH